VAVAIFLLQQQVLATEIHKQDTQMKSLGKENNQEGVCLYTLARV
jgi:hypothetical protein